MRDYIALDEPAIEEQARAQRPDGGWLQCVGVSLGRRDFLDDINLAWGDPMTRTVTQVILSREKAAWLAEHYAVEVLHVTRPSSDLITFLVNGEFPVPLCKQQIPAEGTE